MSSPETTEPTWQERMEAKALARAKIVDRIARMLWENGPQSADWDGGCPPSWDDITDGRRGVCRDNDTPEGKELNDAYAGYHMQTWRDAEAILALDHKQCFELAGILLAEGQRKQDQLELDLWRKVERAAGYMASTVAKWAAEALTLRDEIAQPMWAEPFKRFILDMRERLDRLEERANG